MSQRGYKPEPFPTPHPPTNCTAMSMDSAGLILGLGSRIECPHPKHQNDKPDAERRSERRWVTLGEGGDTTRKAPEVDEQPDMGRLRFVHAGQWHEGS